MKDWGRPVKVEKVLDEARVHAGYLSCPLTPHRNEHPKPSRRKSRKRSPRSDTRDAA